ncbi:DUF2235 domain-containing protein [Shewanella sp. MEBiC00475]|uniref:DUF2235 domain-containing protein n=1 Tax=Shewanella sp. MEBiC00475 TaxID=2575361 RepID=UPI0010BFB0D8|nr:DUF2235 domain-containing protein [Shewanella sp. MEBiC00475]
MNKRIVICADGTWNRPEKDLEKDHATNVLKLARAIKPIADDGVPQQVFYDWGIGSSHDAIIGGITGRGLNKNIMDAYRYIVQNYSAGDEIYLFGFSRGAYTVRCLCGLINNCGIVTRPDAKLIQHAFEHYKMKTKPFSPEGERSVQFRQQHSHPSREVEFVGVWDTVGAMGIPLSFLGMFEDKDEFYDTKLGRNVKVARHALALDEHRSDFEPTIWAPRTSIDIQQVWFVGAHSNIGGSVAPNDDGSTLSDIALQWMISQARAVNLTVELHLSDALLPNPMADIQDSYRSFYRVKKRFIRELDPEQVPILLHQSVKTRWLNDSNYRPKNLVNYIDNHGWPDKLVQ